MKSIIPAVTLGLFFSGLGLDAQEQRVLSPAGHSAVQVGGTYDVQYGYVGGQWIDIYYGRPVKRCLLYTSDAADE